MDKATQPAMIDEGAVYKFLGVRYQQVDAEHRLGEEVEFTLRGRVCGDSTDLMSDDHERRTFKIKVESVRRAALNPVREP